MSSIQDARIHLDEAIEHLTLEAYRGRTPETMERDFNFTLAEELERVDRAIGPAGKSIFFAIAASIRAAFVEVKAARAALGEQP
jgi:hypothetical protein